ncbi:TetR/AcrR family transcriptional regulator [Rhodococcus sp. NPDC058521]|uniref:TetR/AcrR family transcriptional regulator n=1 Tax=Rhodococcus sp. NPDC058521 TaxID=3346536 RepID=UPI00364AF35C
MNTGSKRGSGRPRKPEVDARIHDATISVLTDVGYGRLSYELVADAADVSRPTLYRRAAGKAALVVAALIDRYGVSPVPDTGTVHGDLLALQEHQIRFYNDPVIGAALPGLLADIRQDQSAAQTWVEGFVSPRRAGTVAALRRAKARGEIEPDTDEDWVCEVITGPLISSAFLTGPRPLPEERAADTVELVMKAFGRTS